MPENKTPVMVVATSAWLTPEFITSAISIIGILVLILQDKDVVNLIPVAYQPVILKVTLAVTAITNIVGNQLRNRPTLLGLLPGQTQAISVDRLPITEATVKDATSKS